MINFLPAGAEPFFDLVFLVVAAPFSPFLFAIVTRCLRFGCGGREVSSVVDLGADGVLRPLLNAIA
jgi:hypothetical protein